MDFNTFIDAFTDVIADKVAERLKGGDWPNIEVPKGVPVEELIQQEEQQEKDEREPVSVPVVVNDWDTRRVMLGKIDVRSLRKLLSNAGAGSVEEFSSYSKQQVLDKAIEYEKLIGHTLEDEIEKRSAVPDDDDVSEPEAEDDDSTIELTRESALELDLPKLREIAAQHGRTPDQWKGMDIEALVDLIFDGPKEVVEPEVDEDDDEGYTEEEIRGMSLAELKDLAKMASEQLGVVVEYDRDTEREDLADRIIKAIS